MPTDNRKKIPPLFAVPEREAADDAHLSEEKPARRRKAESPVCPLCFGTGLEVVPGKGARRCECRTQESREKLITAAQHSVLQKRLFQVRDGIISLMGEYRGEWRRRFGSR